MRTSCESVRQTMRQWVESRPDISRDKIRVGGIFKME